MMAHPALTPQELGFTDRQTIAREVLAAAIASAIDTATPPIGSADELLASILGQLDMAHHFPHTIARMRNTLK